MRTTMRAFIGSALITFSLAVVSAGQTVAAEEQSATTRSAPCNINDGRAVSGSPVGSNPTRYEFGNSPYVGARYNSCTDVIQVYFGGGIGLVNPWPTHYNVIYGWQSGRRHYEFRASSDRMVWTVTPLSYNYVASFHVQACYRATVSSRSTCTRWSPNIDVAVTH
jgi:hypothetical protein